MVDTRDTEEAIDLYARFTTPVRLELPSRRPAFEWRGNCVAVGSAVLSAHALGGSVGTRTDAVGDVYSLSLPTGEGRGEGSFGDETVELKPEEQGILISPGRPARGRLETGYEGIQLNVGARDLEDALFALTGVRPREPLVFDPRFSVSTPAGAAFLRLFRFVLEEADREDGLPLSSPVGARLAEALLCQMLLSQPHNHSELLRKEARPPEPRHVRRIAEYLDANLDRPIRMAELAALTGVGARAIREGFRRHHGQSPLGFLRLRRLARARQLLLTRDLTVTQIALACGFDHMGRFSAQYRAAYGENPTETRKKANGRRGRRAE